ncbi:MAG: SprT family zinc-dependent metalloprotease [Arcobacter sp.]|uniref:M48 family metallopeptidase n=1 Tax=Arcobacter sp. TaxID=1872629 RepID=UPI002A74C08E|nr:SprT family zinc-dependent metalloprotease [Arcobacter sp.]MDY3199644.1 SprT family zinc-dependent metalloprotease [Arcobacter sp.]
MSFQIEINKKIVTVKLENKKNIKHCYMRVIKDDLIHIRANFYFTIYDAKSLVEKKREWIETSIAKLSKNIINEDEFLYLGERKKIEDFRIKNLDLFYKKEIQKILPTKLEEYSRKMSLFPTSISYRKNKRTWGSCNYKNGLNFNILLMKFPIEVMEYVIVHELAHIKHKNHSKDFWNLVAVYCPNYKEIEKRFKNFL